MTSTIQKEYAAAMAAAHAGNHAAANAHWRCYVELLRASMHTISPQAVSAEQPRQPAMPTGSATLTAGDSPSSEGAGAGTLTTDQERQR